MGGNQDRLSRLRQDLQHVGEITREGKAVRPGPHLVQVTFSSSLGSVCSSKLPRSTPQPACWEGGEIKGTGSVGSLHPAGDSSAGCLSTALDHGPRVAHAATHPVPTHRMPRDAWTSKGGVRRPVSAFGRLCSQQLGVRPGSQGAVLPRALQGGLPVPSTAKARHPPRASRRR